MNKELVEDAPATTTDNAGAGLISPQLPIKPKTVLSRYTDMKKKSVVKKSD